MKTLVGIPWHKVKPDRNNNNGVHIHIIKRKYHSVCFLAAASLLSVVGLSRSWCRHTNKDQPSIEIAVPTKAQ